MKVIKVAAVLASISLLYSVYTQQVWAMYVAIVLTLVFSAWPAE